MRRKVTLNLDDDFIRAMDRERGDVPRSRWIERGRLPQEVVDYADTIIESVRSPEVESRAERFARATQR